MTPLLSSVDAPHKKAIFTRYGGGDAVRTERYHYLEMRTKNGAGKLQGVALFDLEKDPAPKRGMVLLGLKPFFFYSIPPDWVDELFFTHLCTELWHFRGIRQDRSILR